MGVKTETAVMHLEVTELKGPPVNHWKLRERHETNSPLQPAEDASPEYIQMSSLQNCCLSHPVLAVKLCMIALANNYRKSVKLLDPFSKI